MKEDKDLCFTVRRKGTKRTVLKENWIAKEKNKKKGDKDKDKKKRSNDSIVESWGTIKASVGSQKGENE